MRLTHLSLFSGIGGIDLAAEWAGFETVGQCEFADYPTKVLEKHWPDVPRWRDIRTLTKESFYERTGRTTVDIISGGFPCQPFSVAGKQRGHEDDRYLWPEMLRVIEEIRPTWVLGENVANIVNMALDEVCAGLESQNYEVQSFIIPACGVNAPHKRDRVFILAYTNCNNQRPWNEYKQSKGNTTGERISNSCCMELSQDVADTDGEGLQRGCKTRNFSGERENFFKQSAGCCDGRKWWSTEPGVGRVAHGIPNRSHRLKCLGNAVVPQQVYPILKAIAELEATR